MVSIAITTLYEKNNYGRDILLKTEPGIFEASNPETDNLVMIYLNEVSKEKYYQNYLIIKNIEDVISEEKNEYVKNELRIKNLKKNRILFITPKEIRDKIDYLIAENATLKIDISSKKQMIKNLSTYSDEDLDVKYTNALLELGFKKVDYIEDEAGYRTTVYNCENLDTQLVNSKINSIKNIRYKSSARETVIEVGEEKAR